MSDDFVNPIQIRRQAIVVHEIKHSVYDITSSDVLSDLEFPSYKLGSLAAEPEGPRPVVPMNLSLWFSLVSLIIWHGDEGPSRSEASNVGRAPLFFLMRRTLPVS
jgi:hypothetical protein